MPANTAGRFQSQTVQSEANVSSTLFRLRNVIKCGRKPNSGWRPPWTEGAKEPGKAWGGVGGRCARAGPSSNYVADAGGSTLYAPPKSPPASTQRPMSFLKRRKEKHFSGVLQEKGGRGTHKLQNRSPVQLCFSFTLFLICHPHLGHTVSTRTSVSLSPRWGQWNEGRRGK